MSWLWDFCHLTIGNETNGGERDLIPNPWGMIVGSVNQIIIKVVPLGVTGSWRILVSFCYYDFFHENVRHAIL